MLGRDVGNKSTWMSHKRFCKLLLPAKIYWPYLLQILTSVLLKVAVNTASHIFPIDNILTGDMLLNAFAVVASFGIYGISSCALSSEKCLLRWGILPLMLELLCVKGVGWWIMSYMLDAPLSGWVVIVL